MKNYDETRDKLIEQTNMTYEAFKAYEVPRIQDSITELVAKINFYGAISEFMNRRGDDLSDGLILSLAKSEGHLINNLWEYFRKNEYGNVKDDTDIIYLLEDYTEEYKKQQANQM